MKNKEEEPKEYFERNVLLVIVVAGTGFYLDWLSMHLLLDVNPWGTATAIPASMPRRRCDAVRESVMYQVLRPFEAHLLRERHH